MKERETEQVCESLDELLDRYGDMVYRVALQNMRSISDAEDLSQDVFIKIMQKHPSFESVSHEKAWILRVTMNACKDRWKYNRLRSTVELQDQLSAESGYQEYGVLYEVMKLPQKYRNVIYLFYYEDMSVAMIAEVLQKKQATILTWLRRARNQLKKILEEGDLFEK